jgi:hypothetical protein
MNRESRVKEIETLARGFRDKSSQRQKSRHRNCQKELNERLFDLKKRRFLEFVKNVGFRVSRNHDNYVRWVKKPEDVHVATWSNSRNSEFRFFVMPSWYTEVEGIGFVDNSLILYAKKLEGNEYEVRFAKQGSDFSLINGSGILSDGKIKEYLS